MDVASLDREYFERLYHDADDPWQFATSAYEREKYDRTLDLFGGPYRDVLEIGCSIGVLTHRLAARCERLLALDISERAVASARRTCAADRNVRVERTAVPRDFPAGRLDAVVLSEVGYYWSDADLALARERIAAAAPGGILTLCHFLPKVDDYVRDGDAVHAAFLGDARFRAVRALRAERYRIDVLRIA